MTTRSLKAPKVVFGVALVAFVALLLFPFLGSMNGATASTAAAMVQTDEKKPQPTPTPTGPCVGSWPMKSAEEADHTNNRWFYEGIAEIKSAVTPEEATKAAGVFVEKIKEFPHLLAGASKVILGEDVDKAALVNKDGCATDKAVEIHTELGLALATAKSITANEAPTDAWNTGVQNENVVGSSFQGIDGDRKAIQVVLEDGRTIWILARCGNIATPGKPPVPEGPTDQPPPPPTCPPGTVGTPPDCIVPKDPSEDPGPRGNAPDGHGPNDDTGPGTYVPPGDMEQPPDTPRVNPPPPPPAPPEPPTQPTQPTKPVPTKDPQPPPPPEPEAPTPEAPETECVVIPGIEDCK